MTVTSNENLMTSVQVIKQLKVAHTDKPDIKAKLLNYVEQFQCLDCLAKSLGLVSENFSFVNRVPWKTIFSGLDKSEKNENESGGINLKDIIDTISRTSSQLENEIVPQLQKWRNNWMLDVILIEFVFFGLLSLAVAGVTHIQGLWNLSGISISLQPFLYERPVFSLIIGAAILVSFIMIHFSIRNFVAKQVVEKINKEISEFDLAGAFIKNTHLQHSVFRPDIVGWGWLRRKCLFKNSL